MQKMASPQAHTSKEKPPENSCDHPPTEVGKNDYQGPHNWRKSLKPVTKRERSEEIVDGPEQQSER